MIKRDENGIVVEFEDEKAVASMTTPQSGKAGDKSPSRKSRGGAPATREELEKICSDDVASIVARTAAESAVFIAQATAKVAQIEKASDAAKEELRKALQSGINETNRICREAIGLLKADHETALAVVRKSRYEALDPVQVDYALTLATFKAKQDTEVAVVMERFREEVAKLKTEQASDDKLAAVVAESQAAATP